jgi:GNAT superfamily N-acetyltransferase
MQPIKVRPVREGEKSIQNEIIRQAWRVAYRDIYTPQEILAVFENTIPQIGSWVIQRTMSAKGYVAEWHGEIVGTCGVSRVLNGDGEVTSLYVLPQFHGRGVGLAMWETCLNVLYDWRVPAAQVWTIAKADAVKFYEKRGCYRWRKGSYRIGDHSEPAIGFRYDF